MVLGHAVCPSLLWNLSIIGAKHMALNVMHWKSLYFVLRRKKMGKRVSLNIGETKMCMCVRESLCASFSVFDERSERARENKKLIKR